MIGTILSIFFLCLFIRSWMEIGLLATLGAPIYLVMVAWEKISFRFIWRV